MLEFLRENPWWLVMVSAVVGTFSVYKSFRLTGRSSGWISLSVCAYSLPLAVFVGVFLDKPAIKKAVVEGSFLEPLVVVTLLLLVATVLGKLGRWKSLSEPFAWLQAVFFTCSIYTLILLMLMYVLG